MAKLKDTRESRIVEKDLCIKESHIE